MNPRLSSVESIFLEAVATISPEGRAAFLDETCGGDADLRRRVAALLAAHDNAGTFLNTPAFQTETCETAVLRQFRLDRTTGDAEDHTESASLEHVALKLLDASDKPGLLGALGPYDITELIGYGGMGAVFKAHDQTLNRIVAIKVLAPLLASHASAHKRFLREAQAAAAVTHDNVVTIHAIAEAKGMPYLVMEYVKGASLEQKISTHGPLEVNDIVRIGQQIAAGLAAAHAQGLIHRDIKPVQGTGFPQCVVVHRAKQHYFDDNAAAAGLDNEVLQAAKILCVPRI
jgi:eukaryotic-like serine/threonine-protein kinase